MADRTVAHAVKEMLIDVVDHAGLDLMGLCEGLPVDPRQLRRRLGRLDWDVFAGLTERVEAQLGEERFRAACSRLPEISPIGRRILPHVLSPRALLRFVCRLMGPSMYPMYDSTYAEHTEGGVTVARLRLELQPGLRGCRAAFVSQGAALASLPGVLGQPPFPLREELSERVGEYHLTLPR